MITIIRIAAIIFHIFARSATARNGCRQCVGIHSLTFQNQLTLEQVTQYMELALSGCATGNEYKVDGIREQKDCDTKLQPKMCKTWELYITVWRYCGNGGAAIQSKSHTCINNVCSIINSYSMYCYQSVECAGKCEPKGC